MCRLYMYGMYRGSPPFSSFPLSLPSLPAPHLPTLPPPSPLFTCTPPPKLPLPLLLFPLLCSTLTSHPFPPSLSSSTSLPPSAFPHPHFLSLPPSLTPSALFAFFPLPLPPRPLPFLALLSFFSSLPLFPLSPLPHPQLADYLIDPLCRGVFAGDAKTLSLRSCFPLLYNYEKEHGSLVKGALRSKEGLWWRFHLASFPGLRPDFISQPWRNIFSTAARYNLGGGLGMRLGFTHIIEMVLVCYTIANFNNTAVIIVPVFPAAQVWSYIVPVHIQL